MEPFRGNQSVLNVRGALSVWRESREVVQTFSAQAPIGVQQVQRVRLQLYSECCPTRPLSNDTRLAVLHTRRALVNRIGLQAGSHSGNLPVCRQFRLPNDRLAVRAVSASTRPQVVLAHRNEVASRGTPGVLQCSNFLLKSFPHVQQEFEHRTCQNSLFNDVANRMALCNRLDLAACAPPLSSTSQFSGSESTQSTQTYRLLMSRSLCIRANCVTRLELLNLRSSCVNFVVSAGLWVDALGRSW